MKAYIAIPTFNGGDVWKQAAKNIKILTRQYVSSSY
jgi:hypothetical protein